MFFVFGVVQVDQVMVQGFLVGGIEVFQCGGDGGVDVGYGVVYVFVQVMGFVVVMQFYCFFGVG